MMPLVFTRFKLSVADKNEQFLNNTELQNYKVTQIVSCVYFYNGCRINMDIMTGENCRQFSLLTWNSFIGQFVHPVRGKGMG